MSTIIAQKLESIAATKGEDSLFHALKELSLEDIGTLLIESLDMYPTLSKYLPEMPSAEVQNSWTGSSGRTLLDQTTAFANSISSSYKKYTSSHLDDKKILDYGCGWGRIIRLMYKFTSPSNIFGCDPWDKSIELCKAHKVNANLELCEYIPKKPMYPENIFDLVYAFSVFTHLSEKTCQAVLETIHHSIKDDGMLAITVRPFEYWDMKNKVKGPIDVETLKQNHIQKGFSFLPHTRPSMEGEVTYGDTSISVEYIEKNWKSWKIIDTEQNKIDNFQKIIYLSPVK